MNYGWRAGLIALVVAAIVCGAVTAWALKHVPSRLVRTNVDGREVPAVLGWGVAAGILGGHLVWAVAAYIEYRSRACLYAGSRRFCPDVLFFYPWQVVAALIVLSAGMFAVGLWDDLKGDERPRGFRGHLDSARHGRWTGGLVKLVGGSVTALLAVWILSGLQPLTEIVGAGLCVAMMANLLNLFDRAPGRAGKVFLLLALPAVFVATYEEVFLAGAIGAIAVTLPLDLQTRGMLGDAGANTLGAFLGLALAVGFLERWGEAALWVLAGVLLALNLASEKWSFSEVIAKNRVLARLDHLGRE